MRIFEITFEFVSSRKIALERIAKPYFKKAKKFREDLTGLHMLGPVIELNRLIQVGFVGSLKIPHFRLPLQYLDEKVS